jgi:hypothetical protein
MGVRTSPALRHSAGRIADSGVSLATMSNRLKSVTLEAPASARCLTIASVHAAAKCDP